MAARAGRAGKQTWITNGTRGRQALRIVASLPFGGGAGSEAKH